MASRKGFVTFFAFTILVSILGLSPAISILSSSVTISSNGQISSVPIITAASGSAIDIQAAINWITSQGGIGTVKIPAGTFNFVNIGEPWATVHIPSGVSISGAPTEKDNNDQVIEWRTVLVMPYEVPTDATWFRVELDSNKGFRFSDIKLVGWRYFDYQQNGEPDWAAGERGSETMYTGLSIYDSPYLPERQTEGLENFRVDHCNFQDMAGSAIWVGPSPSQYNRRVISGVIDHNIIVNSYGDPGRLGTSTYENRTLGYGIGMRRWASDFWEEDFRDVIMGFHNYTIFIENNYFSKWRHCVCANDGLHYVFRYNTVDGDYGVGSVDSHGSYATADRSYAVGTRAAEIYGNTFKSPAKGIWDDEAWAINIRGGCAIITGNILIGYDNLVRFNNEQGNSAYQPKCSINNCYIWNNNLGNASIIGYQYEATENVNFFLRSPTFAQDNFVYTPYPYPHPMT